eukprot:g9580.t1
MEVLPLASALFFAGSAMRKAYCNSKRRGAESTNTGNTNVEVNVDMSDACESTEGAIIAVGAELAMKAHSSWIRSRMRRNRAIPGLSKEFAEHRSQVRCDLTGNATGQQSASQAIAEELVGIHAADLQTDKLTRGKAAVRTDLGTVIEVDGIWNSVSNGLLEVSYAVRHGTAIIYRSLEGLQEDMASLHLSIDKAQRENSERFQQVSSSLQALEEYVRSHHQRKDRESLESSLNRARMYLNEFTGTGGGEPRLLDQAKESCTDILVLKPHSDTLGVHFLAGSIAIAASFTKHAQKESPARAKAYVFDGVFRNVILSFESFWTNLSRMRTRSGRRVVEYLLSIVSSICMLPPEGLLLPQLDDRLVKAFGVLCSSEPAVLDRFPEVGGAAVRALLQSKPLDELCRMSTFLEVDMTLCDNKADLIQGILDVRKSIPVDAAMDQVQVARTNQRELTSDVHDSSSDDDSTRSIREIKAQITAY